METLEDRLKTVEQQLTALFRKPPYDFGGLQILLDYIKSLYRYFFLDKDMSKADPTMQLAEQSIRPLYHCHWQYFDWDRALNHYEDKPSYKMGCCPRFDDAMERILSEAYPWVVMLALKKFEIHASITTALFDGRVVPMYGTNWHNSPKAYLVCFINNLSQFCDTLKQARALWDERDRLRIAVQEQALLSSSGRSRRAVGFME